MRIEQRRASLERFPRRGRAPVAISTKRNLSSSLGFWPLVLALSCGSEEQGPLKVPSATGGSSEGEILPIGGSSFEGIGGAMPTGDGGAMPTGDGGAMPTGDGGSGDGDTQVGGGGAVSPDGTGGNTGAGGAFVLTSPAFESADGCSVESPSACDVFPDINVSYMDNANLSPELHWTGTPPGTQSFAVVLFDVTYGQAHWALWNIPGDNAALSANIPQGNSAPETPAGSQQATANFATTGGFGYFGPHLPCNVFEFELYALSIETFYPARSDSSVLVSIELAELSDEEVLGVARLTGRSNDYMTICE